MEGRSLRRKRVQSRLGRMSARGADKAGSHRRGNEDAGTCRMSGDRLGIGFVGSGFNARFHIQAFTGVRDADVLGVWSPNPKNAAATAALARDLDVGDAKAYSSIREMVADPRIEALWLCSPNQARI